MVPTAGRAQGAAAALRRERVADAHLQALLQPGHGAASLRLLLLAHQERVQLPGACASPRVCVWVLSVCQFVVLSAGRLISRKVCASVRLLPAAA